MLLLVSSVVISKATTITMNKAENVFAFVDKLDECYLQNVAEYYRIYLMLHQSSISASHGLNI